MRVPARAPRQISTHPSTVLYRLHILITARSATSKTNIVSTSKLARLPTQTSIAPCSCTSSTLVCTPSSKTNQQAASLNKEAAINLGKELRARIAALETEVDGVAAEMLKAGLAIPNTCHASVPIGPEESSKVLRVVHGHVPVPSHYITDTAAPPPPPHPTATADAAATTSTSTSWRSHVEIAEQHDLVNFQQVRPQLQRYIERERSRSMR